MKQRYLILLALAALLKIVLTTALAQGIAYPQIFPDDWRDCTRATVGTTVSCGLVRVTAIQGSVTLSGSGPYTLSGNTADYFIVPSATNRCQAGQVVPHSTHCYIGELFFRPVSTGSKSLTLATITSFGLPAAAQYLSVGSSYVWTEVSEWSGCVGGSSQWTYSSWSPAHGCGDTQQTRSASCVAVVNSGTETLRIACLRDDGTEAADSFCTGTRPANSRSCTPPSGFSCAAQEATSRILALTDTCSFAWVTGPWGTVSENCSVSATQTRSVTCRRSDGATVADSACTSATRPDTTRTVSEFSGCTYAWQTGQWSTWSSQCDDAATRSRPVSCVRSDGTVVADAQCTNARPVSSETGASLLGCEYAWLTGEFGECSGGTAQWILGDWLPVDGCGPTDQTRAKSCLIDAHSGRRTRTVDCLRSDESVASDSQCELSSRPDTSASCTPASVSCGTPPIDQRSVALTGTCPEADESTYAGCIPDRGQNRYCVFAPL